MTVTLERLRWWDIERLVELEELLFPTDSPWTAAMFWSELAAGHHYVVHRDPETTVVLGYAGLAPGEDAEVQTVGVHPSAQGRGIGRALMDDLIRAAAGAAPTGTAPTTGPAERILLEVRTDNRPAIALYESLGFGMLGIRRGYYQPSGADAYTMEKVL